MVSDIDEVPSLENGIVNKGNVIDKGSDVENNFPSPNEAQPNEKVGGERLRSSEQQVQSSSTDESDRVVSDNEISISNDRFDEVNSLDQLTGVFPISSSGVGTVSHSRSALHEQSFCKTSSQFQGTNDVNNSENSERDTVVNINTSSKPRLLASLRTVTNNNENDSTKTVNRKPAALTSLEKSKKMIEMFSKKQTITRTVTAQENNCRRKPQTDSSRIFVTEELDDDELEVEWPADVLSPNKTEGNVNSTKTENLAQLPRLI